MRYTLPRPPRWRPDSGTTPLIVYLDQWCWNALGWDRAGQSVGKLEEGIYAFLKDLALSGRVVFPLSASHYRENWARENLDGRWDTAVVMAELSGFNSITTEGLTTWETKHAVSSFLGLTSTPASPPTPFSWGASHHVSPLLRPIRFILDQTGEEP